MNDEGSVLPPILSIAVYLPRKAPWLGGDILVLLLPFRGLLGQNDSKSLLKSLEQ
jgi:hypothetical protein